MKVSHPDIVHQSASIPRCRSRCSRLMCWCTPGWGCSDESWSHTRQCLQNTKRKISSQIGFVFHADLGNLEKENQPNFTRYIQKEEVNQQVLRHIEKIIFLCAVITTCVSLCCLRIETQFLFNHCNSFPLMFLYLQYDIYYKTTQHLTKTWW